MRRCRFIAREQSYQGNTLRSLSVGGHKTRNATYLPLLNDNVGYVNAPHPYRGQAEGDDANVMRLGDERDAEFRRLGPDIVCKFLAEALSSLTFGAVPPPAGYLQAIKAVCDRHEALYFLDKVLTGMGRTGTLHAWQQEDAKPHIQTVAEGLGAGYQPIGALLVSARVVEVLANGSGSFDHNQTYQGHPAACAASYEVQQIVLDEQMLANVQRLGTHLEGLLRERLGLHKHIGDIRS